MAELDQIAGKGLMARDVVVRWMRDVPWASLMYYDQFAAVLLARLAEHDPPLLLATATELEAAEARVTALEQVDEQLCNVNLDLMEENSALRQNVAALRAALEQIHEMAEEDLRLGPTGIGLLCQIEANARAALDAAGGEQT